MDGGAWWAAVRGDTESWTQLSDFPFTLNHHPPQSGHNSSITAKSSLENSKATGSDTQALALETRALSEPLKAWRPAEAPAASPSSQSSPLASHSDLPSPRSSPAATLQPLLVPLSEHLWSPQATSKDMRTRCVGRTGRAAWGSPTNLAPSSPWARRPIRHKPV